MWRTYTEEDTLAYSFIDSLKAMWPYYVARALGGLLFLVGAVIGLYNILMTIRSAEKVDDKVDVPHPADLALAGE